MRRRHVYTASVGKIMTCTKYAESRDGSVGIET
jgi:hypothetical protein